MDELFTNLFGPDYCEYEYTEMTKHCVVVPDQFPLIDYNHEEWERKPASKPATEPKPQSSKHFIKNIALFRERSKIVVWYTLKMK